MREIMSGKVLKVVNWLIDVPVAIFDIPNAIFEESSRVESTDFTINHGGAETKWSLLMVFNYTFGDKKEKHFIILLIPKSINIAFGVSFSVFLEDHIELEILCHEQLIIFHSLVFKDKGNALCFPQDMLQKNRSRLIKDGKLHVKAVIRKLLQQPLSSNNEAAEPVANRTEENFRTMLLFDSNDIVELKTSDGTALKAHKAILASKSIVFQTMFETDMVEKEKKVVNIIDFRGKVMEELLMFICVGKVCSLQFDEIDVELYEAAKTYQIDALQKVCAESIISRIEVDNVFEIVAFAALHGEQAIFDLCCDVIGSFFHGPSLQKSLAVLSHQLQLKVMFNLYSKRCSGSNFFCTVETLNKRE